MLPDRQHPLARSPLIDRLNGLLAKAWSRGWLDYPSLDPERLWRKARRGFPRGCEYGGRSSQDVADFALRVEKLCASVEGEAGLNPLGRAMAHGQVVRIMRQHLALGRLWKERPDLPRTPLAPPILILGQMRAGTTRLHRLLAADPALAATRFCDSWNPVPAAVDLRPLMGATILAVARRLDPWLDTLHPFGAARADEELGWLTAALSPCALEAQWRIPSYTAWSEDHDPAPVYREIRRILATDAAHHGNAGVPRVMKVPQFAEDLPTLLAAFPDARVVTIRRSEDDVLASAASLVANQMAVQSNDVDPHWIGREWRRKLRLREARMAEGLADWGGPLASLDYAAFERDWRVAMRRCYTALKLPFTAEAQAAMLRVVQAAKVSPHRRHEYDAAAFGLNGPNKTAAGRMKAA